MIMMNKITVYWINQIMQKIRTEFNMIDIRALSSEENWWSIILEQIEMGVM